MLIQALNLQRSKVLHVAGNSCSILSRLDRRRTVASREACFMLWAAACRVHGPFEEQGVVRENSLLLGSLDPIMPRPSGLKVKTFLSLPISCPS